MKVPYLNKKIDKDFGAYIVELETSAQTAIRAIMGRPDGKVFFASVYPLFALLQGLTNADYLRNPSQEILASEYQQRGDKAAFLRVRAARVRGPDESAMRDSLRRVAFGSHFDELFSDALLLLNSYYMNNYRGAGISLRCMLEDLYRSLYYRDHPEELALIGNKDDIDEIKLGLRPNALREYLRRVSYLSQFQERTVNFSKKATEKDADIFSLNEDMYARCSSFVHGAKTNAMSGLRSNEELQFSQDKSDEMLGATRKIVTLCVAFLIPAYLDHFIAFNEYEKSIILMAFDDETRANYRSVLNV